LVAHPHRAVQITGVRHDPKGRVVVDLPHLSILI